MTGIYIHVPFCKQACRYCDFYFTISLKYIQSFHKVLEKEILCRRKELAENKISTIYFGGGTPSLLSIKQLESILYLIKKNYPIEYDAEITIETNPDDLGKEYSTELINAGFNRISIGVQSFFGEDLLLLKRSHNEKQAKIAVETAYESGFRNITIDLIYGMPGLSIIKWYDNLKQAFDLPINHLSAYHLTFEPGTIFDHWRKKGKITPTTEENSVKQYNLLREKTAQQGFSHYEISNFAKENLLSKHNLIYWNRNNYIGMGPSAHSFNGETRRWNSASLKKYIAALNSGKIYFEEEALNDKEKYHDYLITSLRTKWGLDRQYILKSFGENIANHFEKVSQKYIASGKIVSEQNTLKLTPESWFISDHIMGELFINQ